MTNKSRIAIVVSTFPPYRGGMGSVAEQEARLLAGAGHDVTVITVAAAGEKRRAESGERGYEILELPALFRFGNAAFVPALWRAVRGFDVVHLHYPFFGGAEVLLAKKIFTPSFRYVLTYHMDVVGAGWLKTFFSLHSRTFLPLILKRAERIIVSSRDYVETSPLLKSFWSKIESKIVEIPFPAPRVDPIPSTLYPQPSFLFIGGLDRAHYFKGVPVLLEAFALASPGLPTAKLSIVGGGDLKPELEARARELGIEDRVTFHGSVAPGPEFDRLIRSSRALILPSLDRSEAFGLVLLDALSRGVPVIASDLPGVRTVATNEVGLRVPPGDATALAAALVRLGTDETMYSRLSANALRIVEARYTETRYLAKLEQAL